jgi:hypothetical protein
MIESDQYEYEIYNDEHSESDSESKEIDYPDASEVQWSDDEDTHFHHNGDSSIYSYILDERSSYLSQRRRYVSTTQTKPYPYANKTRKKDKVKIKAPVRQLVHECSICLDICQPTMTHLYCSTQCGNVFHDVCIREYTKPHTTAFAKCPLCRTWSNFIHVDLKLHQNTLKSI